MQRNFKDCGTTCAVTEYTEDYNLYSHRTERKRKIYHHQSPQLPYRPYVLDYIKQICTEKKFSRSCLHLAVYFLDLFMDSHQVNIGRLPLVAICSIQLAASVEENNKNVPNLTDLISPRDRETLRYFNGLTKTMLEFFDWDLLVPTPAHHIVQLTRQMINYEEMGYLGIPDVEKCMTIVLDDYLETLLKDVHLLHFHSPSRMAAALIAACRVRFGLPVWNNQLKELSQYDFIDFKIILDRILFGSKHPDCINCYEHYHFMN